MSELQISLIAFGGVLVAAVWGYNVWQERKYHRRAEAMLPASAEKTSDVLMAGREFPRDDVQADASCSEPAVLREPAFEPSEPVPSDQHMPESKQAAPAPAEWADGRADCLLRIEFSDPISVAALWADLSEWAPQIDKPMQWLGLDDQSDRWRSLLPQEAFSVTQVMGALQLADRKGAVSEETLASFCAGVHQLAQHYAGLVELPDQAVVRKRARQLDELCASVDLQLAIFVVPRQGSLTELVGAKLGPEIDSAGLRTEGGRYVAFDALDAEVFALTCQTTTTFSPAQLDSARLTALVFTLDVPRVANGAAGFDRMVACAQRCAEVLGGQLVDAHKKPLPEATIMAIRKRIDELQNLMALHDIPAGGVRALRLFA